MRNETSRDVTCDCTYEAVVIEDGLARPVLLAHELMSSLQLFAVTQAERCPDDCSVVGSLGQRA